MRRGQPQGVATPAIARNPAVMGLQGGERGPGVRRLSHCTGCALDGSASLLAPGGAHPWMGGASRCGGTRTTPGGILRRPCSTRPRRAVSLADGTPPGYGTGPPRWPRGTVWARVQTRHPLTGRSSMPGAGQKRRRPTARTEAHRGLAPPWRCAQATVEGMMRQVHKTRGPLPPQAPRAVRPLCHRDGCRTRGGRRRRLYEDEPLGTTGPDGP